MEFSILTVQRTLIHTINNANNNNNTNISHISNFQMPQLLLHINTVHSKIYVN